MAKNRTSAQPAPAESKPQLAYRVTASIVTLQGEREGMVISLPYLSILRNDPRPPKPFRLDSRPRKRLTEPEPDVTRRKVDPERVMALLTTGMTQAQVAAQLDCSVSTVSTIARRPKP